MSQVESFTVTGHGSRLKKKRAFRKHFFEWFGVRSQISVSTELLFDDKVHQSARDKKKKKNEGKENATKHFLLHDTKNKKTRVRETFSHLHWGVGAPRFLFTMTLMNHCNITTWSLWSDAMVNHASTPNAHRLFFLNLSFWNKVLYWQCSLVFYSFCKTLIDR